uniref:HTH La-type RNA-binding domain-containing protein n=1 Tax=Loxodonta africana TaxID=9785 RepID=G3U2Z3_LOXAF
NGQNCGSEKTSALWAKICHQVEYCFGDFNLLWGKFLKEQIKLGEGWIPLEIRIKINKLNHLTTDFNVIGQTLNNSKVELIEISEDKIRRSLSKPLPGVTDDYKNDVKNRSAYMKGFATDAIPDDIKEWLEDKSEVLNIQMKRTLHKALKGLISMFDSTESANKVIETPGQKYKDTNLLILLQEERMKKESKVEAKLRTKQKQVLKQKIAEDFELKSLEGKIGCLLKFWGDDDQTCREDLHIIFSHYGEIKWINFVRGVEEGVILLKEKDKEVLDKAKYVSNGELQLRNNEVTWK